MIAFGGIFYSIPCSAYEVDTHVEMSKAAFAASNLPGRLKDFGIFDPKQRLQTEYIWQWNRFTVVACTSFFGLTRTERLTVEALILRGAFCEDVTVGTSYPLRYAFHLYDPAHNGAGYSTPGGTFSSSLQWGLETAPIATQEYSYKDAKDYLYKGLTLIDPVEREKSLALTFRTLGHVMHLVQDLASPQHTRNDSHATGSLYERYTDKNDATELVRSTLPYTGYPSVAVTLPEQFWHTTDNKGLADYSNRGFVTAGTNFTGSRTGNLLTVRPNPNFSLPDGTGVQIIKKQITDPDLLGPNGPKQPLQGEMWFVSAPVTDNYFGGPATNTKASTFSIFDEDLNTKGGSFVFSLNRFNFREAHKLLIPKAVGYSAGLINYFFRGTMEITPPAEQVYGIVDHSTIRQTDPKSGFEGFRTIKLKVRNTTPGGEAMTGGKLVAVAKFHRNGCYKDDLSGEFTQDTAGNLITPCPDYRTNTEEIVVSTSVKDAAGNVLDTVSLDTNAARQLTFTFANAIPINATDLYLQVVYRGNLGDETDAVVVATKDLFEPTYLALLNSTDQFLFNGKFVTSTDPALIAVFDGNKDGLLDVPYRPTTLGINFGFRDTCAGTALGYINYLPPARFSRLAILTDRSPFSTPLQAFGLQTGSVFESTGIYGLSAQTNQVEPESGLFRVSAVEKVRGISGYYVLPFYFGYGTPDTGDVKTMPELVDKTPFPVTSLTFP